MKTFAPLDGPPSQPASSGGGEGNTWRLLKVASNQIEAQLIRGMLEHSGIASLFDGFDRSPAAFLNPFGDMQAPARVWVRQRDLEEASMLLFEGDATVVVSPVPRGSHGWSAMAVAVAVVAGLLFALEILGFAPCSIGVLCF